VNDGASKVAGGSMGIPAEGQSSTKRRKGGRKKTTVANVGGSTVAPTNDDDGSSKGEDASKAVIKRLVRAFKQ
jgi:hypothetical protein